MGFILDTLIKISKEPTLVNDLMPELLVLSAFIWIAVIAGVLLGLAWRPRWASWFAYSGEEPDGSLDLHEEQGDRTRIAAEGSQKMAVTNEDLRHLCQLVEMNDGGLPWHKMMDKSMPNFSYQAWCREPENDPPQYRSRTVYEDATPEIVRDFFWDDEFRISNGWDEMLLEHKTLEECQATGTMVVLWVRKFPFFCSDREYMIARRIWQSGNSYYCVTKGTPYDSVPRRNKPRRVDLYYSSWCIRPAESKRDGQMTACEVLLFHHEDMGIPWSIAKLGVKQGMLGCVKKIEPGLRAYQNKRNSDEPLSRSAYMAHINTKFDVDQLSSTASNAVLSEIPDAQKQKHWAGNLPKFFVIGGAVALAFTLDGGLLSKALIFGAARRFAKQGTSL